ncbi:hypothetical protein N9N28_15435 [Rubripirellula amarantea]|nr:hypothetical protein [Rubripirellula amarantea]
MKNPFDLILQGQHHNEVLHAAAAASKFDIDNFALGVPDTAVAIIGDYASKVCRASGVQSDLMLGGLLELFAAVSKEEAQPEVMAELIDEIQVCRTQAYRCRAVWRHFGKVLIDDAEIREKFASESLKLLADGQSCESARGQAIELARGGTKITIKLAKELRSKHGEQQSRDDAKPNTATPARPKNTSKIKKLLSETVGDIWTFTGRVVQIILEPTRTASHADRHAVIEDLQAAIDRLQQEIIDETHPGSELTHV